MSVILAHLLPCELVLFLRRDNIDPEWLVVTYSTEFATDLSYEDAQTKSKMTEVELEGAISAKTVTYDFERLMDDATLLKCSEFGQAIIENM